MFLKKTNKKNSSGFTLIEGLTLIFIFGLITVTFYNVISIGTRTIVAARNRLGAIALGNEKMEIARNLSYADLGTQGGDCAGILPQDEDVTENGKTYHVKNYAALIDDPFDGVLGGSPNDLAFHDYKNLEITVAWNNGGTDQGSVKFMSRFVSPALEVIDPGDGVLVINVFSNQPVGAPVVGANVHIVNADVGIDEVVQTDASGSVTLAGAKESLQKYEITVTKSGYETVNNLAPYPATAYNPTDTYATVIGGTTNSADIVSNKTADIKISTVNYLGNPVPDVGVTLNGGRKLGTAFASPYDPVYNLIFEGQTGADGEKTFASASPGEYTFKLSATETTHEMIGIDPVSPFVVAPESAADIKIKVADKNVIGLLVKVINGADSSLLPSATVKLENSTLGYNETITAGEDGLVFFPVSDVTVFQAGTYDMTVQAADFQDDTRQVTISDGHLSSENIAMVAS